MALGLTFRRRRLFGLCARVFTLNLTTYRLICYISLRLGTHAFHTVLSRKSHEYASVLKSLEFDMRLPQYARQKRLLSRAVKAGQEILATLDF